MKCILVDPPRRAVNVIESEAIRRAAEEHSAYPPVGLAYIAAVLQQNGIEVKIVDAKSLNIPPVVVAERVEEEEPELVGVTVFTSNLKGALETCREIKEHCPYTNIVVGGPHIHPLHREVIERDYIDFCVRGEGEITMLELAKAISSGADLKQVTGITFKDGEDIIVTPDRPFISDLDTLPFPARDLLPNHIYRAAIGQSWGKFAAVSASRGCPFHCNFCQVPRFWPVQRRRSVGNILDELEDIAGIYKIKNVRFTDETLPLNKKWITALCQGMAERGLNKKIAWSCDNRVDTINEDILAEMAMANCQVIFYGIEFGNQRILDFAGKGTTIAQICEVIEMTKKAGITPTGNFMIGYPTETRETIQDTIALAVGLDLDFASISIVTPFPGTELYDYCQENDLLRTNNWEEYSYFHPGEGIIKLDGLTSGELVNLYQKAYFEFNYRHVSVDLKKELAEI